MASRKRQLSPILGAAANLIGEASESFVKQGSRFKHTFEVSIKLLNPDPNQPRKSFSAQDLEALAATMESEGQLQPVLVRRSEATTNEWILVAGERRWRAATINGWDTLLAIEHDGDPEVASLLENLQRVDLNPREEATALQRLIDGKGWTQTQAGEALGRTRSEISGILKILTLSEVTLNVLTSEHALSRSALIELARVSEGELREHFIQEARAGRLTVKAIRLGRDNQTGNHPEPPKKSQTFNFSAVERLAQRLSDLRIARGEVTERDRARLIRLRQEIEAMLDAPG